MKSRLPDPVVRLDSASTWLVTLSIAYGTLFGAGYLILRGKRAAWKSALLRDSHGEGERISREATPRLAELNEFAAETGRLGESLDLHFVPDVAAGANALFGELAKHYPGRSDAAVVRAALALCRKRLQQLELEYAEDAALYWEAIAAIAEADVATARTPAGELLVRLGDLKERLFAPGLMALLNRKTGWWKRETGASDYRNIVSAIIREAQALAAGARGGEETGMPPAVVPRGEMGKAEAYAVLGTAPATDGEEIARLCSRLLEVWAGDDAEAKARRQELQAAAARLQGNSGGRVG